jgi:hypothetical protein
MSYNGSGTFNINTTGQPVVAGTVISSSSFNSLTNDLATGLTTAITKDGQTTTTARITFAQGITSSLTTDSSSVSTGSIITAGGAGIAKNLYVGGIASFSAQPIFTSLTASSAVATDASKGLVSVTNTGTGNNVLATSPTLVTPALGTPASGVMTNVTGINYDGFKNRIINGAMGIAQRGTSFTSGANNDDAYVLDRFYILSDGNDAIDVTQTTTVPTGAKYSIGLDVETANKKFGIAQIIENANCFNVIGGNATLSFQAKVSSTTKLDNVKCAIVSWSGTADTVTSDIISAWGAEGTNPTLIANATYENTPANLNVTTSFATYSVTANVDTASTANIIVFIWSDVTDTTAGDFLYITNVQLEKGSTATSFDYRPYTTELQLCQRYYEKSYDIATVPGASTSSGAAFGGGLNAGAPSSSPMASVTYKVSKRSAATVLLYDAVGNSGKATTWTSGVSTNNVTASAWQAGETGFLAYIDSPITAGIVFQWTINAEL